MRPEVPEAVEERLNEAVVDDTPIPVDRLTFADRLRMLLDRVEDGGGGAAEEEPVSAPRRVGGGDGAGGGSEFGRHEL